MLQVEVQIWQGEQLQVGARVLIQNSVEIMLTASKALESRMQEATRQNPQCKSCNTQQCVNTVNAHGISQGVLGPNSPTAITMPSGFLGCTNCSLSRGKNR